MSIKINVGSIFLQKQAIPALNVTDGYLFTDSAMEELVNARLLGPTQNGTNAVAEVICARLVIGSSVDEDVCCYQPLERLGDCFPADP